jgi:hypothetical protein
MQTLSFEMPHWHGQIHHIWQYQMFSRDEQCTEKITDKEIIRIRRIIENIRYYVTASKNSIQNYTTCTVIYIYKRRDYQPTTYPHYWITSWALPKYAMQYYQLFHTMFTLRQITYLEKLWFCKEHIIHVILWETSLHTCHFRIKL